MDAPKSGFVSAGDAQLFYQTAGAGQDLVMLHAGVADHRQWTAAFEHFAKSYRVVTYDRRGFGRSEPTAGRYRAIDDLKAVLHALDVTAPAIMMGGSMGGTLAMDFTIAHPEAVSALILVCSGPSGLTVDAPEPKKFAQVEQAEREGDLDRVCELETQIWFDGELRSPGDVDPKQRALLYEMNHQALIHEATGFGDRELELQRLNMIDAPVLIVVGELDLAYTHAAADCMCANIRNAQRVSIAETAHLPNMERPQTFNQMVEAFLNEHEKST